jgi:hypothetical protein
MLTNADLDRDRCSPSVMVDAPSDSRPEDAVSAPVDASAEALMPGSRSEPPASRGAGDQGMQRGSAELRGSSPDTSDDFMRPRQPRDEAWWRQRAEALSTRRLRLAEQQRAVQNRIDLLAAEVAGRDDPFQRSSLEADRRRALEELEALSRDVADLDRMVEEFEESARRLAIPPGWIRGAPG